MVIIDIKNNIEKILDDNKAQNITCIDLKNKSYIADYMVIASGTSSRHLQALSEILVTQLKKLGIDNCCIEGKNSNDWKLVELHEENKIELYNLRDDLSETVDVSNKFPEIKLCLNISAYPLLTSLSLSV